MENINDLRKLLLIIIQEVKNGQLDQSKAQVICGTANSIVNLTKLEMAYNGDVGIQFMNYDVEDDISESLKEIEERNKEPYKIDSKD